MKIVFVAFSFFGALQTHGQTTKNLEFKTKFDRFTLVLQNAGATIDGKPADLSTFRELLPLLSQDLGEECPALRTAPDVNVTEDGKTRSIHIKQGVVTDGKKCLYVSGDGLMYFPIHRQWFLGNQRDGLSFGSQVTFFRGGKKILALQRKGKIWTQANIKLHPDWDFIEKFENSLREYTVKMHGNLELAKGKKELTLVTNGQTARLFQITPALWALQKSGTKWLVISSDWSQWFALEPAQFEDHRANQLRFVLDKGNEENARISALQKLDTGWSRALSDTFVRLLTDREESYPIQKISLERLRTRPTLDTAGAMVAFLQFSSHADLKKMATQVLRIQNPKGRLFDSTQSAIQQSEVIEGGSQWWKKTRPAE